jgi:excinuclease ABC subunit A
MKKKAIVTAAKSKTSPPKNVPASDSEQLIEVRGAREHNLRNLDVSFARGRFTVVTGVSGSGKSSLVFDTLYAEGYRKYMDSLSTRARAVLEQLPRPNVDFIHGLSPVIAVEQRTAGGGNSRSTVATVTEIADFARVLWAVAGQAFCPLDGGLIRKRTIEDCLERIFSEPEGSRVYLLAPILKAKPSVLREELPRLSQRGFQRVRIDGVLRRLDEGELIDSKAREQTVDLVVDRLVLREDQRSRMADSLELAMGEGNDRALLLIEDAEVEGGWRELSLSRSCACEICGTVYEELTPRHFSWHHYEGACPVCGGLGETLQFEPEWIVPDTSLSVRGGAVKPWRLGSKRMIIERNAILKQLAEQVPFDGHAPWRELPDAVRRLLLHGDDKRLFAFKLKAGNRAPELKTFDGILADLEHTRQTTSSDGLRTRLMAYQRAQRCHACDGKRLRAESLHVRLNGLTLPDFLSLPLAEARTFAAALREREDYAWLRDAVEGLSHRLRFLDEVGLGYLALDRNYATLSGGESQRVRLATQLGMALVGVIYVLDEPSIGLHPLDNRRLIQTLLGLRDRGNTVIVVEHDGETMAAADHLLELGPGAGEAGGAIIFNGTPAEACEATTSISGPFLSGKRRVCEDVLKAVKTIPKNAAWLSIEGASEHNLQSVDARFPVGRLTVVCGPSGSGKSSLINDTLAKAATARLNGARQLPGQHKAIRGLDAFRSAIEIDQSPIGRSPRSNPATFTKLFDALRDCFARCSLAKVRGYDKSRFSFNIPGGRCEQCKGDGVIKVDMQFMADVYRECPACHGKRYNRETLDIRYRGYTIADALEMTVDEALTVFGKHPRLREKLETLQAVGLGYVRLGQSATTLSGGEAQRLKLSLELSKRQQGDTLYILDEPTTGLHWLDVERLMELLFRLRDAGNTLIVIEHHPDVVRLADWVVALGPGGGSDGGKIIYQGEGRDFQYL